MEEIIKQTQQTPPEVVTPQGLEPSPQPKKKFVNFFKKSFHENNTSKIYSSLNGCEFDAESVGKWAELKTSKMPKRRCHHLSFVFEDHLYIYGGMDINEGKMTDLNRVALNAKGIPQWEEIQTKGANTEALTGNAGVCVGNIFYMFGGENQYENSTNNLYMLKLDEFKWEKRIFIEKDVPIMNGHTISYYPKDNSLIVFGGFSKGSFVNYLYSYSIETNQWTNLSQIENDCPSGRINHSAIVAYDCLYIFGGMNENYLNDMWKFNLIDKNWEKINFTGDVPVARSGHTAIFHELNNSIYIFGGKVSNIQERNDFWKFDINKNEFIMIHDVLIEKYNDETAEAKRSSSIKKTSILL